MSDKLEEKNDKTFSGERSISNCRKDDEIHLTSKCSAYLKLLSLNADHAALMSQRARGLS